MQDYVIVYNPLAYNLMDIHGKAESPLDMITYLTGIDTKSLDEKNYIQYLDFDIDKHREGMVETFAIESYAALYIGNQIARLSPNLKVIHATDKRRTIGEIIKREAKKPKAVFITSMSSNFPTAVAFAISLNFGNIPVIIGGIHVSTSPDDIDIFIKKYCPHPEIVSQVIGAGDSQTIKKVLDDLDKKKLEPQFYGYNIIEDQVWIRQPNVEYLDQLTLDSLARIPLIGKLLSDKLSITPVAPFLGCPYSCNFCSISTIPKKYRKFTTRSADDFLNELEHLQKDGKLKSRFFFLLPDNFLLGGKNLEQILDGIIERKLKVNFATQISIDVAENETLLRKLREAGATHFFIGFETLDLRNLEYIGKHILKRIKSDNVTLPQYYRQQIKKIQNYGISIHGAFIFGLPYDYFKSKNDNTGKDISEFCLKNKIGLQPGSLTDLPGSESFKESQENALWLYGKKGTMDYLLALCLTDLTEINKIPSKSLYNSPLMVAYIAYEAIQKAASSKIAIKNSIYSFYKSFTYPTARGRESFKERLIDAMFSFASQLIVALYRDHGEKVAFSSKNVTGSFERLYRLEKNYKVKSSFEHYVEQFKYKN